MTVAQAPSLLEEVATYDGHLVGASRTGSGKTTLMLAAIAFIDELTDGFAEWLCVSGKASVWMGLEDQIAADEQPRVLNASLSTPATIEPILRRLRWAVQMQEKREAIRLQKTKAGEKVNPRPIYTILDEWLILLKVAKRHDKASYQEMIDLVETIILKGRQDKVYVWLFAQGHHCKTLHLDGDLRTNLGVIALGGAGNYQSITAAIADHNLIEDNLEREALQSAYQELLKEDRKGRIYYSSIGGHQVCRMIDLPDMEQERLFEADEAPESTESEDGSTYFDQAAGRYRDKATGQFAPEKDSSTNAEKQAATGTATGQQPASKDERDRLEDIYQKSPDAEPEAKPAPEVDPVKARLEELERLDREHRLKVRLEKLQEKELELKIRQYQDGAAAAENRWNLFTLGFAATVFIIYIIPPFSGTLQTLWKGAVKVGEIVATGTQKADSVADWFAPALKQPPRKGEDIAGYRVTSVFGPRPQPCAGCSTDHKGVDLGTPTGTPVYLIGKPGEKIKVKCWWDSNGGGRVATYDSMGSTWQYLHLSSCASGSQIVGSVVAKTGGTGLGSGEHFHIEQIVKGVKVAPPKWAIWWSLTGSPPQPVLVRE